MVVRINLRDAVLGYPNPVRVHSSSLAVIRTPENPPRGMCHGPDKNLTVEVNVCARSGHFLTENFWMYVSQSGQFSYVCGRIRTILTLVQVCIAVWTISRSGKFFASRQSSFWWTHTSW